MRINNDTKVEELGYLLRTNGYSLGIEYGSGGYAVSITDLNTKVSCIEYSHDLISAIKNAFERAMDNYVDESDFPTIPHIPAKKSSLSLGEISKLLSSGSEKNVKY